MFIGSIESSRMYTNHTIPLVPGFFCMRRRYDERASFKINKKDSFLFVELSSINDNTGSIENK